MIVINWIDFINIILRSEYEDLVQIYIYTLIMLGHFKKSLSALTDQRPKWLAMTNDQPLFATLVMKKGSVMKTKAIIKNCYKTKQQVGKIEQVGKRTVSTTSRFEAIWWVHSWIYIFYVNVQGISQNVNWRSYR